jgi:hypothetical protein
VEDRTAVETLLMSVSQDPHTSKAKSFHIEDYKIFLKVLLSTTAVASPNMLAAVGQDVYVPPPSLFFFFFFLLLLAGSKKSL